MAGEDSHFDGLSITLKKRKLCVGGATKKEELSAEEYLVLGHFDQMTIRHTDKWLKWAPYHTENISLKDEYIDKYNIKAYFPMPSQRVQYQQEGFDYDIWLQENTEYPFVIASVINISDEYAKSIRDEEKRFTDAIFELILECVQELSLADSWKDLHGAFFPTIGYSDLVLLFKTADPEKALTLIERIGYKKKRIDGKYAFPYLSNAYTFLGFCNHRINKIKDTADKNLRLEIRFGMKDGVTVEELLTHLNEAFGENIGTNYRTIGDSDLAVFPQLGLKRILPEYFFKEEDVPGILHPAHKSFDFIRSMQTNLYCNLSSGAQEKGVPSKRKAEMVEECRVTYMNLLERMEDFLKKNRMPGRIAYGLQIVMKRYLQMIQSRHCFDMEQIIGSAFDNFVTCTEKNMAAICDTDEDQKYEEIRQMLMALNTFREKIGEYLADMQRSDSLFLEGRSLSHPSIGSATKLMFFYNGYIDRVKELISKDTKEKYSFVVISGGTDQTQAIDLFSHLDPTTGDIPSIILVTVPEASLYDVKSSLFHVLHEMLHFCGNRERRRRVDYIIDAVCGYTANAFGDLIESSLKEAVRHTMVELHPYISDEEKTIYLDMASCRATETSGLKLKLKRLLETNILNAAKVLSEEDIYGRKVYDCIFEIIENLFYPEDMDKSLKYKIYEIYQEYQVTLLGKLDGIMKKHGIPYSNFTFITAAYEKKKRDAYEYDIDDMGLIEYIVGIYFGRNIELKNGCGILKEEDSHIDLVSILNTVENLFKECYADCMAGDIMKIEFPQFVMSFLSEARNEREAFSNDILTQLRMKTDFQYLFGIENSIPENVRNAFTEYAKKEKEKEANHIHSDDAIEWLRELIATTDTAQERTSWLINPVLKYLQLCKEKWHDEEIDLQDIQKLNRCTEMDKADETYEFLNYVEDNWIRYAG